MSWKMGKMEKGVSSAVLDAMSHEEFREKFMTHQFIDRDTVFTRDVSMQSARTNTHSTRRRKDYGSISDMRLMPQVYQKGKGKR